MQVNPVDTHSMRILDQMIRTLHTIDSKFIQPGFKFNYQLVGDKGYYYPSYFKCNFVNGCERNYNMTLLSYKMLQFEMKKINHVVEFERNMQGQDDELEDDA